MSQLFVAGRGPWGGPDLAIFSNWSFQMAVELANLKAECCFLHDYEDSHLILKLVSANLFVDS